MAEKEGGKPRKPRTTGKQEAKDGGRSSFDQPSPGPKHFSFGKPREEGDNERKPFRRDSDGEKPTRRPRRDDASPAWNKEGDKPSPKRFSDEKPARRPRRDDSASAWSKDGDKPSPKRFTDEKPTRRPRRDDASPAWNKDGDKPAGKRFSDDKPTRRPRRDDAAPAWKKDGDKPFNTSGFDEKPRRSRRSEETGEKPFFKRKDGEGGFDKPFEKRTSRFSDDSSGKPFKSRTEKPDRDTKRPRRSSSDVGRDEKPRRYGKADEVAKPYPRSEKFNLGDKRGFGKPSFTEKPADKRRGRKDEFSTDGEWLNPDDFSQDLERSREKRRGKRTDDLGYRPEYVKSSWKGPERKQGPKKTKLEEKDGKIRLNKYISNAGICSRREADDLIKSGAIRVNGEIVSTLGFRVSPIDKIQYGDQTLSRETRKYLLLNKPKDYITTANDPEGRKTVMELVKDACRERLYPVGRLDRATTGLLLMTNDGELAKRLTHPSHGVRKIYHVTLNKNLQAVDLKKISEGLMLEDGLAEVDEIAWASQENKKEVGIVLHSGKNRIVRRIFEHLGYEVAKLDRTGFAGLTKKNLPRGKFRFLTEKEVIMLRMG